jgi:hypothetical protein
MGWDMHSADKGAAGAAEDCAPAAANDDLGPAPPLKEAEAAPAGWDPFEVWATRIRDARRASVDRGAD